MRIPRIYTAQALQGNASIELEPGPSQHLARVLRLRRGDSWSCSMARAVSIPLKLPRSTRNSVQVMTGHQAAGMRIPPGHPPGHCRFPGRPHGLDRAKGHRAGCSSLTPLFTERTEVKLSWRAGRQKTRHWQQIAISACEQCGRNRVPTIHPLNELSAGWRTPGRAQIRTAPPGSPPALRESAGEHRPAGGPGRAA